ncbi:MAG: hypothetical protein L0Y55_10725, partial [Anaerolineales bacterium]|nr:hypothetical protein [Anaerolineales bacterium]
MRTKLFALLALIALTMLAVACGPAPAPAVTAAPPTAAPAAPKPTEAPKALKGDLNLLCTPQEEW